jgi:hypothetical protein
MRGIGLVALLLCATTTAQAAVTLTFERKERHGKDKTVNTVFFDGERVRSDEAAAGSHATESFVFDRAAKKVVLFETESRTYYEVSEAEARTMKERFEAMTGQLPPDMRQSMGDRMMGAPPPAKYEKTGKQKKIAGYACDVYKVTRGDRSDQICYAPWGSLVADKAEAERFQGIVNGLGKSAFAALPGMTMTAWSDAPGVPLEETRFAEDGKKIESTSTLKAVSRAPVPASVFQSPAGFRKTRMPLSQ